MLELCEGADSEGWLRAFGAVSPSLTVVFN